MKQANWILIIGIIVAMILIAGTLTYHTGITNKTGSQETSQVAGPVVKVLSNDTAGKLRDWLLKYSGRL